MLIFYKWSGLRPELKVDQRGLEVKIERPFIFGNSYSTSLLRVIRPILWLFLSVIEKKLFISYNLYLDHEIVSSAEISENLYFFPFMDQEGIHIGPCNTKPECRGRGYYPYLL